MISKDEFKKIFSSKFVSKLKESLIPHEKIDKNKIIYDLYEEVINFAYSPYKPRGYIIINKHNYVARICPTFYAKDYFLYFFCCKMIEEEIAGNRIEGTFGGWRLGNKIRLMEEIEAKEVI